MAHEQGREPRRSATGGRRVANGRRRVRPASEPRAGRPKSLGSGAPPLGSTRVAGYGAPQPHPYDPWNKGVAAARTPFPSLAPEPAPETEPDPEMESEPEPEPESETEAEPESETEPEPDSQPEPDFGPSRTAARVVAEPPPSRASGPTRARPVLAPSQRRRFVPRRVGRMGLVAALAAAGVLVAVVAAIWLVSSGDTHHAPSAAHDNTVRTVDVERTTAQAARWMQSNVAKDATVFAPTALLADLHRSGITQAAAVPGVGREPAAGFLLSTPSLRSDATVQRAVASVVAASLPVAQFGAGASRVEVRQVSPDGLANLQQRRMQDLGYRKLAGTELLRNPHVQVSADARNQLGRGDLDLRAETLLAVVANSTDVRVVEIVDDPAEEGFGLPARTVVVSVGQLAPLQAAVAGLPGTSKPAISAVSGKQQLDWQLSGTALETLQ